MDHEANLLSRATVLRRIAAAPIAIGALAALQAEAEAITLGKTPMSAVQYQSKPKNGQQCNQCKFFVNGKTKTANGGCTQVAGSISPSGWCVVYSKGSNSSQKMS